MSPRKMTMEDQETDQQIPPMPGSESQSGPSSRSIGSEETSPDVVSAELAADLIDLPYQAWATFNPDVPKEAIVLSEQTKAFIGGPVARMLEKYGLGKIAKDEIVVIATLSLHTFSAVQAIRKAKASKVIPQDETTH